MAVLIGCEESQAVTIEFRKLGIEAYSCDLKPCSGGHPEWHLQCDVFKAIEAGALTTQSGEKVWMQKWDLGIFFPDCTYLTCSAEWAYKEGPYHMALKPGTLTGQDRQQARNQAILFFLKLYNSSIPKIAIENPVGVMSRIFRRPDQCIHPYLFGEDASKKTCLWLKKLPVLQHTLYAEPRLVNGKKRWGNQTDSGQNNIPPSTDRAEIRSKTFPGIAAAMADQWSKIL